MVDVVRRSGSGFVDYLWPKPGSDKPAPKLTFVTGFAPWSWIIGTGVYVDDLEAQAWTSKKRSLIAAGLVLLFTLAVSVLVARRISGPLQRMTAAMKDVASGKRHLATAKMRLDGSTWKVVNLTDEGLGCTAA